MVPVTTNQHTIVSRVISQGQANSHIWYLHKLGYPAHIITIWRTKHAHEWNCTPSMVDAAVYPHIIPVLQISILKYIWNTLICGIYTSSVPSTLHPHLARNGPHASTCPVLLATNGGLFPQSPSAALQRWDAIHGLMTIPQSGILHWYYRQKALSTIGIRWDSMGFSGHYKDLYGSI